MDNYIEILKKVRDKLEANGYDVAYVCLYGSQNYNLDLYNANYKSDIDVKAFIIPTLKQLISNSKPVSTILEGLDIIDGQIDLKDIRVFTETLMKGNPTYIEALYAKYYVFGSSSITEKFMQKLLDNKTALVKALEPNIIKAIYGMAKEKEKALCHPYPSIVDKIEKYGYDSKQLSHIIRLKYLMEDYFLNDIDYGDALWFKSEDQRRQFLLDVKQNIYTLEDAKKYCDDYINSLTIMKNTLQENIEKKIHNGEYDFSIKTILENEISQMVYEYIIDKIKEEF